MVRFEGVLRTALVFFLLLTLVEAVPAWNVQSIAINPAQDPIAPKTPVVVTSAIHFGPSYSGLSTFENDNTFDMYTDLSEATWTVTKNETFEDRPAEITKLVENKRGPRVRIDGWELSYGRRTFDLSVRLEGTAPDVSSAQSKIMIRVQELNPSANPVEGSVTTRKYLISAPAPATTPATPAPSPTPAVTTQAEATPSPTTSPTVKRTYSPGPEPVVVAGVLGLLVVLLAVRNRDR